MGPYNWNSRSYFFYIWNYLFGEILRSYLSRVNPTIVSKKIPKSENRNLKEQNLKIIECHPDRSKCQLTNSLYDIMEVIKPWLFNFCPLQGAREICFRWRYRVRRYRAEITEEKHWKGNVSAKMHMAFLLFILILISGKILLRYIFKLMLQTRPLNGLHESNRFVESDVIRRSIWEY